MEMTQEQQTITSDLIKTASEKFALLRREVGSVVVGNQATVESIIIALLCNGHILLEGVPGVAKTTMIKAVADSLGLHFKRVQFTPDLLPADVIGTLIYNPKTQEFETKHGPVFANLLLADEINRAPAKVQSALLEAMQERQVTIGNDSFALDRPFFVFATQNPIEQEGTYQLPEAQLDRFMFKLLVTYPSKANEHEIITRCTRTTQPTKIISRDAIFEAQRYSNQIYTDARVTNYIVDIIHATRRPADFGLKEFEPLVMLGASPRASIALYRASKAVAFLAGRHFVTPDDVKAVAPAILRHRIILGYEAQVDQVTTDDLVTRVLDTIPTP